MIGDISKEEITRQDLEQLRITLIRDALNGGKIEDIEFITEKLGEDAQSKYCALNTYKVLSIGNIETVRVPLLSLRFRPDKYFIGVKVDGLTVARVHIGGAIQNDHKYTPGDWEVVVRECAEKLRRTLHQKALSEEKEQRDRLYDYLGIETMGEYGLGILSDILNKSKDENPHHPKAVRAIAIVKDARLFTNNFVDPTNEISPDDHGVKNGDSVVVVVKQTIFYMISTKVPLVKVEYGENKDLAWMFAEDVQEIEGHENDK